MICKQFYSFIKSFFNLHYTVVVFNRDVLRLESYGFIRGNFEQKYANDETHFHSSYLCKFLFPGSEISRSSSKQNSVPLGSRPGHQPQHDQSGRAAALQVFIMRFERIPFIFVLQRSDGGVECARGESLRGGHGETRKGLQRCPRWLCMAFLKNLNNLIFQLPWKSMRDIIEYYYMWKVT